MDRLDLLRGLIPRVREAVSRHRHNNAEFNGLHVLCDPKDAEIDIVAVHGLGGQGFHSWTSWDSKARKAKPWLQELLGADIPNARIMAFGYLSDGISFSYIVRNVVYGQALDLAKLLTARRRRDHTNQRPLFFIAHSLGGWIVKRALIISSEAADPDLKDIELSTSGVAFIGTLSASRSSAPPSPSSPSPLVRVIRRTTSGVAEDGGESRAKKPSASEEPLASDMEWLAQQMEAFKAIAVDLPILSFYETKKSSDGYVVEQKDSITGSDGFQIGLQATHSELIRFHGRDTNYQTFIDKFREMLNTSETSGYVDTKRRTSSFKAVNRLEYLSKQGFSIPYRIPNESSHLVPRKELLSRLEHILSGDTDPSGTKLAIANIRGPTGVGKSTLARHYLEKNRDHLSFAFWIRAESRETVIASYLELADTIVRHYAKDTPRCEVENDMGFAGLEDMLKVKSILKLDTSRIRSIVRVVKDWLLCPDNVGWVLVFDNVGSSYNIVDFIPLRVSGRLIFTSRDEYCCPWGEALRVGIMKEEEAISLLGVVLGEEAGQNTIQGVIIKTHRTSGSCIEDRAATCVSSTRYSRSVRNDEGQRLEHFRIPGGFKGTVESIGFYASPVSFSQDRVANKLYAVRLSHTSCAVWRLLATRTGTGAMQVHSQELDRYAGNERLHNDRALNVFQEEPELLHEVLKYLLDQNLILVPANPIDRFSSAPFLPSSLSSPQGPTLLDYFVVHKEVRDHVRSTLTDDERSDYAWMACSFCIDGIRRKEVQSASFRDMYGFGKIMGLHAIACFEDWSSVLDAMQDDFEIAWNALGQVCMAQGALDQAIGCFELSLRQTPNKMDPSERIETTLSLSSLLNKAGRPDRSCEILTDVNIIPHLDQALHRVVSARAATAASQGDLTQAADEYQTLKSEQDATLGPTHPSTVSTIQSLARTLEQRGKLEEAQVLYRRVYISYLHMYGPRDNMTLEALDDLANICKDIFAIDDAQGLFKQSATSLTRALGANHPETAYAIQSLAIVDDLRGRYIDAKSKYQHALAILAPTLGKAHPLYTMAMENMALSTRRHAQSLAKTPASIQMNPSRTSLSLILSRFQTQRQRASRDISRIKHTEYTLLRTAASVQLFEEAERLYLEILAIKKAALDLGLYSDEDVASTSWKLEEMYESEAFFEEERLEKFGVLVRGRRRG
ncbi:hypothetical protein E4U57_000558 [Claviceps arundinis]|uniref:Uncharacterized protein n=1 Tax=Claviceps arundinis TaxID=1623583 RepID=A0ABQ7PD34_9HYPO|nr:hypothetical protein E4U57_000558 [Claviceps arundinis]